jgi:hypothetical protein
MFAGYAGALVVWPDERLPAGDVVDRVVLLHVIADGLEIRAASHVVERDLVRDPPVADGDPVIGVPPLPRSPGRQAHDARHGRAGPRPARAAGAQPSALGFRRLPLILIWLCHTPGTEDTPHVDDQVDAVLGSRVRSGVPAEGTTAMVTAPHPSGPPTRAALPGAPGPESSTGPAIVRGRG